MILLCTCACTWTHIHTNIHKYRIYHSIAVCSFQTFAKLTFNPFRTKFEEISAFHSFPNGVVMLFGSLRVECICWKCIRIMIIRRLGRNQGNVCLYIPINIQTHKYPHSRFNGIYIPAAPIFSAITTKNVSSNFNSIFSMLSMQFCSKME